MYLSRKSLLPLALVFGLFGTPTLSPAHAPGAPGAMAYPPVVEFATADGGIRGRRRVRGAKVRRILWRAAVRLCGVAPSTPPAEQSVQPRRPRHHSFARAPPRSAGL